MRVCLPYLSEETQKNDIAEIHEIECHIYGKNKVQGITLFSFPCKMQKNFDFQFKSMFFLIKIQGLRYVPTNVFPRVFSVLSYAAEKMCEIVNICSTFYKVQQVG